MYPQDSRGCKKMRRNQLDCSLIYANKHTHKLFIVIEGDNKRVCLLLQIYILFINLNFHTLIPVNQL